MRITIEDNELVYIYLLKMNRVSGVVDETIPYIIGDLLYDNEENWIGIRIKDQFKELTNCTFVDEYDEKIKIATDENGIKILFSEEECVVNESCEQDFNIDIVGNKAFGIEIIVSERSSIKKRKIPTEMIEYES